MALFDTVKRFFDYGSKSGASVANAANKAGGAVVDGAAAVTAAGVGAAAGGVAGAAGGAVGFLKGMVTRPGAAFKGGVGIIVAAIAAGGVYMAVRGRKKEQASSEAMTAAALNDLPPPIPDMAAMQQQATLMGMQPTPGQFAQREEARRGAAGQQLGM
jgi:hypothetical protein